MPMEKVIMDGNCKSASIRKKPEDPLEDPDIVGFVKKGDSLYVDRNTLIYNWQGRAYYQCRTVNGLSGYIAVSLIGQESI